MRTEPYWTGREVEGRLLGVETLFVGTQYPENELIMCYPHLYVGKDFLRSLDEMSENGRKEIWDNIRYVLSTNRTVTLEVDPDLRIPIDLIPLCHILVRIPCPYVLGIKPSDTIALDMGPYHCLTVTKHQMLEVKQDQYQFDKAVGG